MPRDVGAYLEDIRDAGAAIIWVAEENDARACLTNRVLRSAVEREFLIIGEAVNKLLDLAPKLATRLTSKSIRSLAGRTRTKGGSGLEPPGWTRPRVRASCRGRPNYLLSFSKSRKPSSP